MNILPIVLITVLSGCASVMTGGKQSVMVATPDAPGSECSLTDAKGRVWYIEQTPGTSLVKKGDGPISVICKKEGYEVGVGQIQETIAVSTAANVLFPVGFLVDGMTGSSEKYDSEITIEMEPVAQANSRKPWE